MQGKTEGKEVEAVKSVKVSFKIAFESKNKTKYEMNSLLAAENFVLQQALTEPGLDVYKVMISSSDKETYETDYKVKKIDAFKQRPFEIHLSGILPDKVFKGLAKQGENKAYLDMNIYKAFNTRLDAIADAKEKPHGIQAFYKQKFLNVLHDTMNLEESERASIEALYIVGAYSWPKIKETISKCSPNVAVFGKEYAERLIKEALAPKLKERLTKNLLSISC